MNTGKVPKPTGLNGVSSSAPLSLPVVSGLGLVVLDEQMVIDEQPTTDTKVVAQSHRTQIGGPVPTALAQLQRFGISTRFLGSWGDDAAGRVIEEALHRSSIEFDAESCQSARASGVAHVWVEAASGRRTVVSCPPQGTVSVASGSGLGQTSRLLHLDGWGGDAAIAAAVAARAAGGVVTFDCGSVKATTERLLRLVDVVNVPLRFLEIFCGTREAEAGARMLLALGPRLITVTDGAEGAGIYSHETACWRPAFPVASVDTCGAGDVFCGGLIFGVLAGYEAEATLEFAMATAALKITRLGNGNLADYDEVVSFLEQRA